MSLESQFQGRNIVRFCGIFGLSLLLLTGCVATRPGFWNNDDLKSASSKSNQASQVASIDDFEPLAPEQIAQSSSGHSALPDDFAPVASEEKRNPFVDDETAAPAKGTAAPIRQVQHTDTPTANADAFADTSADAFANVEKPAAGKSAPAVASTPAATPHAAVDSLFPPDDASPPTKSDTATASTPSIPGDDPNLPLVDAHASASKSPGASSDVAAAGVEPATAAPADTKVAATDPSAPPADPTPESQTSGAETAAASSGGVPNSTVTDVGHTNGKGVSPLFADNDASAPPAEPASAAEVPSAPPENAPATTVEHAASVKELEAADAWTAAPEAPKPLPRPALPQSQSPHAAWQPELQPVPHSPSQSAYWMPQQPARNRAPEMRPEPPESASPPDVVCSSSMICDSNAVRGKFTGGATVRRTENERARQAATVDEPSTAVCSLDRNLQEWQPQGVVHAVANQVDRSAFDGSSESHLVHALAVHADGEHADPSAIAKLSQPEPTEAVKTSPGFSAALKPAGKVPAEAPSQHPPGNSEAWFAIGMSVGLFASVMLWLRLRRKADPTLG
jgi:hypothetical protein